MKHFVVWDAISMAWSEVGLIPEEIPRIAKKLRAEYPTWGEVDRVIRRDIIGSFALESSFMPLAIVPVIGMLAAASLPDWGFDDAYLRRRMTRWYRVPLWRHFLNPLRLVGYPIAFAVAFGVRRKLRAAYLAAAREPGDQRQ